MFALIALFANGKILITLHPTPVPNTDYPEQLKFRWRWKILISLKFHSPLWKDIEHRRLLIVKRMSLE